MLRVFRGLLLTLTVLAFASSTAASGRREARDVTPDEFRREVSKKVVTVMLKDGRHFKAQVTEVGAQTMHLKVTDSKVGGAFATGNEREVSFSDVGTVSFVTHKGSAHWLLPAVVGGAGGAVFLGFVGLCQNERGSNCPTLEATSGGVALGGTFAAALAGDRMDRVEMQLHVIPEKE